MGEDVRFRNPVKAVGFAHIEHVITQDATISDAAYRMYAMYLEYAQQKGVCWPGRKTIAERKGVDPATVSRWNKELEDAGYITRERRFGSSSITWIEDVEQIPRLVALAEHLLECRKNATTVGAKVQRRSLQKCDVEEEQGNNEQQNGVVVALVRFGFMESIAQDIAHQYDTRDVMGWIAYIENANGLTNPAGFLLSRLRKGSAPPAADQRDIMQECTVCHRLRWDVVDGVCDECAVEFEEVGDVKSD